MPYHRHAHAGLPKTMQQGEITYDDVCTDIAESLKQSMERAQRAGLAADKLIVDPGIGFGKTLEHNLVLTRQLHRFHALGTPVLYGPSRKRFLGEISLEKKHMSVMSLPPRSSRSALSLVRTLFEFTTQRFVGMRSRSPARLQPWGVPFRRKACYFRPTASACSSTG